MSVRSTGALAPRLLAAAVAGALVATLVGSAVAPALPGGGRPIVDLHQGGSSPNPNYQTNIPPLVNVGGQLQQGVAGMMEGKNGELRASDPAISPVTPTASRRRPF